MVDRELQVTFTPDDVLIYNIIKSRTTQVFHVVYTPHNKKAVYNVECGYIYTFKKQDKKMLVLGIYVYGGRKYVFTHIRAVFALTTNFICRKQAYAVEVLGKDSKGVEQVGKLDSVDISKVTSGGALATNELREAVSKSMGQRKPSEKEKMKPWMYVTFAFFAFLVRITLF